MQDNGTVTEVQTDPLDSWKCVSARSIFRRLLRLTGTSLSGTLFHCGTPRKTFPQKGLPQTVHKGVMFILFLLSPVLVLCAENPGKNQSVFRTELLPFWINSLPLTGSCGQ